jgi:hypothetical protein
MWAVGMHRGKFEALVQRGNCTVIRDFDRDKEYDYNSGREETGNNFGINFHHAGEDSKTIDSYSAGCQVCAKLDDFEAVMVDVRKARDIWGNSFTYTLLLESDFGVV